MFERTQRFTRGVEMSRNYKSVMACRSQEMSQNTLQALVRHDRSIGNTLKGKMMGRLVFAIALVVSEIGSVSATNTWDDAYDTSQIEVTMVYFVPSDRVPLSDWRQRLDYYSKRIEQFHAREFQGQSKLTTVVRPEPFISGMSTSQLRLGDANQIYYRTLSEVDQRLKFSPSKNEAKQQRKIFPILLVMSEINWRPLDDFFRVKPAENGFEFEGNYNNGQHFPGATSGGARALYNPQQGIGWGLVSADGWRVPYRGSDCVVYHEGCGHTVGLPHPEPGNGSVMSMGQYRGWISESWLDKEQKTRLGWKPKDVPGDTQSELFSTFRAIPSPNVPRPGQSVRLKLDFPRNAEVKSLHVQLQTSVTGPWIEVPQRWEGGAPEFAALGEFDRPTPVSYRVNATLLNGETAELWGYFQVRSEAKQHPLPVPMQAIGLDLQKGERIGGEFGLQRMPESEVDLLWLVNQNRSTEDNEKDETIWSFGDWNWSDGVLTSPKKFGARLQLPYSPPNEYRLTVVLEPLDVPNGLLLGNVVGGNQFVSLFSYRTPNGYVSAIENIDGRNVGNETTVRGAVFKRGQISQVVVTVRANGIQMMVDGRRLINWKGKAERLSLSDYWATPDKRAMFLGAYDCRYRFHRVTLETLAGEGQQLN